MTKPLANDTFLRACRRESTPYTPIWLMRQAGRYQPEYRAIREKTSFLELCKDADLAAEVTVRAVEQLGVDAGIIFADILLVLEPLRIGFEFGADHGPRIHEPVRTAAQVDAMPESIDPNASLGYVMEAIRRTKRSLSVPLLGFAGAPFTLASYIVEGRGSKSYLETKRMMYSDEGLWNAMMSKLVVAVASYLRAQVAAGADALQVFDSWVGCLSPADYRRYVFPHMQALFRAVGRDVPVIHFGTGNPALYGAMAEAGGDVLGIDWRTRLGETWDAVGPERIAIMGNLDPASLVAPREVMRAHAKAILAEAKGRPGHVFNLGHGIMPSADVDQVRALVAAVHEMSASGGV